MPRSADWVESPRISPNKERGAGPGCETPPPAHHRSCRARRAHGGPRQPRNPGGRAVAGTEAGAGGGHGAASGPVWRPVAVCAPQLQPAAHCAPRRGAAVSGTRAVTHRPRTARLPGARNWREERRTQQQSWSGRSARSSFVMAAQSSSSRGN